MPQCKRDNCREEAVPGGKRYCTFHLAAYRAKQKAYAEIAATLPECDSKVAADCTGKLSKTRHDAGDTTCLQCQREQETQDDAYQEMRHKTDSLDAAETVDDLREWIRKYVLDD